MTLNYCFLDYSCEQDILPPKKMCNRKHHQKQVIKGNIKGPWAMNAQTRKKLVQPGTDHSLHKTSSKNRSCLFMLPQLHLIYWTLWQPQVAA